MAIGDKKKALMEGDTTAAMVGARPNTWTPTAVDVGAPAMTGFGNKNGGEGWYRVGTITHQGAGAYRFYIGGQWNANAMGQAIVDVVHSGYVANGAVITKVRVSSALTKIRLVPEYDNPNSPMFVDVYYNTYSVNMFRVNCVCYHTGTSFTPYSSAEPITDEVTPRLEISIYE